MGETPTDDDMLNRFDESDEYKELIANLGIDEKEYKPYSQIKPHELQQAIMDYMTRTRDTSHQRALAISMYNSAVELVGETEGLMPKYEKDSKGNILDSEWE